MIADLLRGFFTGRDNQSGEIGRVLWALGFVSLCAFQGWAMHRGQTFDPMTFSGGVAAILAAGGFGIAQKDKAAGVVS